MMFACVVDGVAWDLHHQIFIADTRLTAQTTFRLQPPGFIQHVIFQLIALIERVKTFAHDAMTRGASTGLLTRVLNFDAVTQRRIQNGFAFGGVNHHAIRTQALMR